MLTSVDVLLDTGLAFADEHNLRHGLGWRYGLQDEFAKVNTGNLATARRGAVVPAGGKSLLSSSGGWEAAAAEIPAGGRSLLSSGGDGEGPSTADIAERDVGAAAAAAASASEWDGGRVSSSGSRLPKGASPGGAGTRTHPLSKAQASAQASGAAAAAAPVWPAVAGLYGPPYLYNALDLELYYTSRTMAVLDAALFHYAAAAGIVDAEAGAQQGVAEKGRETLQVGEEEEKEEEEDMVLTAPCGHIGRR